MIFNQNNLNFSTDNLTSQNLKSHEIKAIGIFVDASGTLFRTVSQFGSHFSQNNFGLELYADAYEFLEKIEKREFIFSGTGQKIILKTALITNWSSKVHEILKSFKLQNHFDTVMHPSTLVPSKPHARIFHSACEELNLLPENCIHFGDALYDDAFGAQNAGLKGVWINRGGILESGQSHLTKDLVLPACKNLIDGFKLVEKIFGNNL